MATKKAAQAEAPEKIRIDIEQISSMTGREVRDLERVQPVKFMQMARVLQSGEMPFDTLYAIAWIFHRRDNPDVSFDEMLDVPFDRIELVGATASEVDPTPEPDVAATGS